MTADAKPPSRIGRFQVIAEHGRDGITRIATASDTQNGRLVTLDIVDQGTTKEREIVLARARSCASFADRQIYSIIEIITDQDPPVIVRDHERGMSLGQTVEAEGAFEPHEAGRLIAQLARVLDRAHARNIVHGRLSIELIRQADPDGPFKIAGFGRALGPLDTPGIHLERLRYAAPEQIRGETATERSDLYALGLIFYCVLVGKPAFEAQDQMLLAAQAGEGDLPSLLKTAPHVPSGFRAIVEQLTSGQIDQRFRTGNALAEAIERTLAKTKPVEMPKPETVDEDANPGTRRVTSVYWPGRLLVAASIAIMVIVGYLVWQDRNKVSERARIELPAIIAPNTPDPEQSVDAQIDPSQPEQAPLDWRTISAEARQEGCTQIERVRGSAGLALDGLISDPTRQIELDSQLRAAGADTTSWSRLPQGSAACVFLTMILPLTEQPTERLVRLQTGGQPAKAVVGDLLVLDIDAPLALPPDGNWYVEAGYLGADGQVVHLTQGVHELAPLEPGSAARVGEPTKGEWFRFDKPGGIEIAFALITTVPLATADNRSEPAEFAAQRLLEQLSELDPPALLSLTAVNVE